MVLSIQKKVIAGFGLASAILIGISAASYQSANQLIKNDASEAHSREVLEKIESLLSQIKDAETGQRGYLLTGKDRYLQTHNKAVQSLKPKIQEIRQLIADNPSQQQQLNDLEIVVKNKLDELQLTIDLRQQKGLEAALQIVQTDRGKQLMDDIRDRIRKMQDVENQALQKRSQASKATAKFTVLTFSVGLFLNFSILTFLYYLIYREMSGRQRVQIALQYAKDNLELRVEERTAELTNTNQSLQAEIIERQKIEQNLQRSQTELIQSEKLSSLGQMVAGVAHEINNPINFIFGNLNHTQEYTQELLNLLHLYQKHYPQPVLEIESEIEAIELDFLAEDLPKMLISMQVGANRIRQIVLSLRNFSRLDEEGMKFVDLHEGLDNTLAILNYRLEGKSDRPEIEVIKEYGNLPEVECYAGQINQVFMNILTNAIDALEEQVEFKEPLSIWIRTSVVSNNCVAIQIADNGAGMTEETRTKLFDPFFTTKPVGKGTGLGLAVSYQIVVEKHKGTLKCTSTLGQGTEFWIELPIDSDQ